MDWGHCQVQTPASSDHQGLPCNRNPIESQLPPVAEQRSRALEQPCLTKSFCGKSPGQEAAAQDHRPTYCLGVWLRLKLPFRPRGEGERSVGRGPTAAADGRTPMLEGRISSMTDQPNLTTPRAPLKLRAETAPANSHRSTTSHGLPATPPQRDVCKHLLIPNPLKPLWDASLRGMHPKLSHIPARPTGAGGPGHRSTTSTCNVQAGKFLPSQQTLRLHRMPKSQPQKPGRLNELRNGAWANTAARVGPL